MRKIVVLALTVLALSAIAGTTQAQSHHRQRVVFAHNHHFAQARIFVFAQPTFHAAPLVQVVPFVDAAPYVEPATQAVPAPVPSYTPAPVIVQDVPVYETRFRYFRDHRGVLYRQAFRVRIR